MKKKNNFVKVLPIIIIILIVLIVSFTLITIGKALFSNIKDNNSTADSGLQLKEELLTVDNSRSVMMRVRSKIVGAENFNSYEIVISPSKRVLTTYRGYSNKATNSKKFSNTPAAYEQFVYALDKANLAAGTPFPADQDDTRGICATGEVYDFDIISDNQPVAHLWTSTCKGSRGSLMANTNQVKSLFLNQIPNAQKIIYQARK